MGVSRRLHNLPPLLFLLLLFCCIAHPISDGRYLRHSGGRRDAGDFPLPVNITQNPGDVLVEEEGGGGGDVMERVVVRGQEVVIECDVPQDVTPVPNDDSVEGEVRWYHDAKRVHDDLRIKVQYTGHLKIFHAVVSDSGIWWCHRSGKPGPPTNILVVVPPERPYLVYGGAQLASGARLTTREGNTLTLHCIVKGGNPKPHLTWLLNNIDVTKTTKVVSVWDDDDGEYNTVSNFTLASAGRNHHNTSVKCIVTHPSLQHPTPTALTLNIQYSPDFRLRRWPVWGTPVREGSSVSLLCYVDANPPSIPTWIKETESGSTEVSSSSGWLNITRTVANDRGWYKCATTHPFGHFASHSVFINVFGESGGGGIHTPQLLRKTPTTSSSTHSAALHPPCTLHHPGTGPGSIQVIAENTSVVTVGGKSVVLSARVCGHTIHPTPTILTWLPPQHPHSVTIPIIPGQSTHRLIAHNLTNVNDGCSLAALSVSNVRGTDSGAWVLVATGQTHAAAALIRLNVTATADAVAVTAAHNFLIHILPILLPLSRYIFLS